MKISVIIPTFNEEDVILDCLKSLSKQSLQNFEIIVVDDGSTDKTLDKIKNFKILQQKHLGAGAARNLGAKSATGEILVFVDSDMTFDQDFIRNLTLPIIQGKTRGTFSKDEYVANWNNVWSRCWNINEGWENKKRHPKNYPDHQPVFRAILKTEFDKVGGFTPGGYDDDWSLSEKLGYEAEVASNAIFYHKNPESLSEIFNHAKWVGKRSYKFGWIGYLVGLIRSSFPVSICVGILRSTYYMLPAFIIFKLVYDFGIFVGIINFMFTKKGAK
ncbi:hypothetical protein A2130_03745 [Candidatus Woesebacteria bacterium GWC2_33_12]|uniref:Glycosyltransferase 2-like domain-containing protein n=1 Tax=Candidatus Woesebacteria bacterium GW2011_GWB1_33_22 TaxID=1618566 RepID=A0A0G0C2S8_9BACT|nr:MAG: hypothetical protein UR29_C0001G0070 [Candidatus Woesebacteria bacterium GW2011_GWC2_33_12]KKP42720.1 MAG: hypothetical protein UR33_C0001G0081 [Candidatus Woesebacteria bacterium GW2011_GWA2_33_20]KKP45505.1 MAG: hypothetical protein UR35_C0001G0102 [Candidatus Woesebacteria bacterium GW2011_GWB1_33_22]KKP47377.1 MAG: hypothetical protein UR37_C0001G0070 [Microgenomates group bacterium GW2011_GWC1_33_28]KKP51123.1 MAG: hypothetical protein UR41_C0001G0070 [Candidatus Woesebacteria bact